ncbi:chromosome segregation protein [Methanocalculus alkaliphilus]|uniref:chromosome segregation protein SMC n=1 Tax=Methanocalculus alkaliphilus TaxID=768730 RepID=UPI0020A02766|nr:chromosome segregation protein SMC [Methanocalculus alkaliphilus]MCP1716270.1 chromosome segregation protein [Methanocalculus alkaliphilus]
MHITQLEIDNFKSFARKTRIPFETGFTVISGPNGSGKSNILDSILFALGITSARGLRAERLTDLINASSAKNTAEVIVSFSDGTRITRRIKRTPNGYYSYHYLNGRLSKQSEILAFLSRHGIKPHGYNIVMQGDVARIMEMSDGERRKIVDEIAGVAEFDLKRDQAMAELEVVRGRIDREEILLHELLERLDVLKNEREQALHYKRLQEDLESFVAMRNVALLREKKREEVSIQGMITEHESAITRIADDIAHDTHERDFLRSEMKEIDEEISRMTGPEYLRILSEIEEAKGTIRISEQGIQRNMRERETNLEAVNRKFADIRRSEATVKERTDGIRSLSIDRANLGMELSGLKAKMEKAEKELAEANEDTEGAQEELFSSMGALEEMKTERSRLLSEKDGIIERSRIRVSERERLAPRLQAARDERHEKEREVREASVELTDLQEEQRAGDQQLSSIEKKLMTLRGSHEEVRSNLRSLEQKQVRLEAQQQAQGEAGGRAIEAVLGMEGVYGTIAQLGRAPPDYATALNVAAGGRLHHVVASDDQIAADAIRFLKEGRLGRVTFLPLSKLRVPPPLPPVSGDGIIDYAIRLIEYDPAYERAFSLIFGTTLVVDTMENGRRLLGRHRMVTLDGDLLERTGAMTGGSVKREMKGFGAAVDREISQLAGRITELRREEEELAAAIGRQAAVAEELRADRQAASQKAARLELIISEYGKRIAALDAEIVGLEEALSTLEGGEAEIALEIAALEERLDGLTERIGETNTRIAEIKKRIAESETLRLSELIQGLKRQIEDLERRLRNKEADITDLQRERQYFQKRIEEMTAEKEALLEKNITLETETRGLEETIAGSRDRISALEEEQRSFSDEIEGLRQKRSAIDEQVAAMERKLHQHAHDNERHIIQLDALRERAQSIAEEIAALTPDVSGIECDLTPEEIEEGIATTERQIRKIGAVNMLAIEEYDRVSGRVTERTQRKEILSRERSDLIERIEGFERMKREAFLTSYHAIDTNFKEIYASLSSGWGQLILENEEDPFSGGLTFEVHPQDKKVHRLNMMSGGEKSLVTLALIFAIQRYMPAPFYGLDEVDMHLDGSNVEGISRMIRTLSEHSQFISISLRKPMIQAADRIIGVTIRPDKSTLVTGMKCNV